MIYQSKTAAWPHQLACLEWINERSSANENGLLLALPMGVGKSKIAVDIIASMASMQPRTRALVLCPLSVVNVWTREFEKHAGYPVKVVTGKLPELKFMSDRVGPVVCVVHYDAAWRGDMANFLLDHRWHMIVADESHKFKALPSYRMLWRESDKEHHYRTQVAVGGKLADFMARIGRRGALRLALTGTPMAHSPADIFSQIRFLDAGKRFGNSPTEFLNRYRPIADGPWVQQHAMSERINEVMWTCPPEVVELPPALHEVREFELAAQGRRAYRDMWRHAVAEVQDGRITAQNGGVRFLRLCQLTSGFARTDAGDSRIDYGKQELLEEFLESVDTSSKVVVFCQFRHELVAVAEAAAATGRRYAEISGNSKEGLSSDATFALGADTLGVQLQSGGVGIDLSAARYCVYFSPGLSLANYEQSLKRVHRPGQKHPVLFVHLVARGTIDTELYRRLEERKDLVEGILELARLEAAA